MRIKDLATGAAEELHPAAAFIFIGQEPNSAFAGSHVELDDYGYILTGHDLEHGRVPQVDGQRFAFETSVSISSRGCATECVNIFMATSTLDSISIF